MKTMGLSKGILRYLPVYSNYSIFSYSTLSSPAKSLVSSSRPFFGNPIIWNKSCTLIISSRPFLSSFETHPSSHSWFLCNYHGWRSLSSFSSSGLCSSSSIVFPCSQSSKLLGFNRFNYRYEGYTSQGLNLYLFSYPGYGSLRLYSVSSSDASQYKKLHTDELRPKATRKQVSVIIGLLITEDNELETKLNSLGVRLSIGSVRWVFQVLNREKKSALQFFHWIRRWQPELEGNSDICSLVIDNCGHLDDYKAMRCLLDGFSLQRLFLTKKAFEYLQLTSSKEELLKKATQNVVDILQEIGGTSYGTGVPSLIEMFSDLGSFDMAKFVIEKTGRKLSYYNVLIRELCRRGDFKAARDLMDEIGKEGCNPSAHTYNYIISSLLKNGKNADACEVFQEMQDNDCPPDALTFEIFIYNSCNEGKLDNAFEFFDDMVARGLEPRLLTHAAFIKGFFNSQQYEKAYKYVVGSDDKYSSNVNYSLLANLHQKQGNLVDAENILSEMIKKGLRPHFNVFMKVKKHLMKSGNEELATSLQKKFLQLEVRA